MKQLDNDDSLMPHWVARAHAEAQTRMYWPEFTPEKQELALQLKQAVTDAYFRSKVYMNARNGFIVIKADRPSIRDQLNNEEAFTRLKSIVDKIGIEPLATKNSLLFRIPK